MDGDVSIKWEEGELAVDASVCHVAMSDITCVRGFQVEYGGGAAARVNISVFADSVKGNIRIKAPINFVSGKRLHHPDPPARPAPMVQSTPAVRPTPAAQLAPTAPLVPCRLHIPPMSHGSKIRWLQNMFERVADTKNVAYVDQKVSYMS